MAGLSGFMLRRIHASSQWPESAIVSRIDGQGASGWIGARRPLDKNYDWPGAGPIRSFASWRCSREGDIRPCGVAADVLAELR